MDKWQRLCRLTALYLFLNFFIGTAACDVINDIQDIPICDKAIKAEITVGYSLPSCTFTKPHRPVRADDIVMVEAIVLLVTWIAFELVSCPHEPLRLRRYLRLRIRPPDL